MTDIFDTKIICKRCNIEMKKGEVVREGVAVRAVICNNCGDRIIHPEDLNSLNHYKDLRHKTYFVKLRMVGNSHAISTPKEILDFMNDQQRKMNSLSKEMNEMVKLCFEDFDTIKLRFGEQDENNN